MSSSALLASHQKARTKPSRSGVIHRRYHDREDLAHLAKCDNINGAICDESRLTSDEAKVTCKRCLRIMNGVNVVRSRPFSNADYRLRARLGSKPRPKPHDDQDEPYVRPDGIVDHSAWAPLHEVRDWLLQLADEDEVPIQINLQAKEMAAKLTRAIPRLGGGHE